MPWIDEYRKDTTYNNSTVSKTSQRNPAIPPGETEGVLVEVVTIRDASFNEYGVDKSRVLSHKKDNNELYKIDSNKNYMFKHNISQQTEYDFSNTYSTSDGPLVVENEPRTLKLSHFLDDDIYFFYTNASGDLPEDRSYNYFQYEMDILSTFDDEYTNYYDYYSYYNSLNTKEVERSISYDLFIKIQNYRPGGGIDMISKANAYIRDFEITELDFFINGFKKNISDPIDPNGKFGDSAGWYYNKSDNSYGFKRITSGLDEKPYYEIGYLNKVNKINKVTRLKGNFLEHEEDVDYKVGDLIKMYNFSGGEWTVDDWSNLSRSYDNADEHRITKIEPPYDSYTDPSGNTIPAANQKVYVDGYESSDKTVVDGRTQFIFETICDQNFIATKINSNNFKAEFNFYNRDTSDSTTSKLTAYLIPSNDFERWRNRENGYEFDLSNYTPFGGDFETGNDLNTISSNDSKDKYLLFHLKNMDGTMDEGDIIFSNFKITGEYADDTENNVLKDTIPTLLSTSDVSYKYDDGTSEQTSFIGNGKFLSGVWENGVWNNGIRNDNDSFQFDDVLNSYPISDGKWRIEIGRSSLLSTSERNLVGEFISIGNIVVININEERKFLKKSYLVVDVIDNYIAIEAEFSFPVRRIERDSDKHKIKVSKNVWLSGAFLSGKFEGIWNDGVFKGNPSNNVMENTQWIDGTFDGGRFISNYSITGNFYNLTGYIPSIPPGDTVPTGATIGVTSNEIDDILYAKLSVNELNRVPLVGEFVNISGSKYYDGDSKILEVVQVGLVYNITIDKEYIPELISTITTYTFKGDSGKFSVLYNEDVSDFTVGSYITIYGISSTLIDTLVAINPGVVETGDTSITAEILEITEAMYDANGDLATNGGTRFKLDLNYTDTELGYFYDSYSPEFTFLKHNITLLISDGLIQNFTFNDNNLSKLTSNNSISSTTVFKYNSWIDVNYDVNEAVNIGRDTKVTDSITGVNTSNNNLYGYPTSDVLSSKSKFRGSNTLNSKIYNLGTKFKKYTDFLGDSSLFEEPFNTTNNIDPFTEAGWSIIIDDDGAGIPNPFQGLELERTSPSLITEGKELKINSRKNGGILNNEKITLEKSRYSIIEFDLIDLPSSNQETTYISSQNNVYPILSFSNLNYETRANFDDSTDLLHEQPINYLPTYKNINLLNTPNSKKVEYFFNKKHLNMDIKGYGSDQTIPGITDKFEVTIDNLKMYEVDMIPFFKYFNESNIFKGIQKPLVGTSPFIEYTLNNFPFIESQSIPFDSIDIKTKE